MVVQRSPHFEFRLLKQHPRLCMKEPERKVHSTLTGKLGNQQMVDLQLRELEYNRRVIVPGKTLDVLIVSKETLDVQQRGLRNCLEKQHDVLIVSEESLDVQQRGIRNCLEKQHDVLIVSEEKLNMLMAHVMKLGIPFRVYDVTLSIFIPFRWYDGTLPTCYIPFRWYDGTISILRSFCKDEKKITTAEYPMLIIQAETRSLPVDKHMECMQSYIQVWPAKKKCQIFFPWFCFDPWLSTKGTERFFYTNPLTGEGYLPLDMKTLSTFLSKMKQVCLVFDENDKYNDKNTDKNITRIREYLESVLGITVVDIYHSFDDCKTEIENIDKCISTSEYFIFIPTRGETSCILKYALNLIVSELFHSSGQNNILTLTDSTQNTCSIPPLLWPFPIFICNFDHNWCRCIWPVVNETDPVINTNCKMISRAHGTDVKMSNCTNRVTCKFKTLKAVRIISDDIEEGELIKKSILLQSPTTKVTVNDDDVPCGALLFYEYAAKLYKDQLFVIVPSVERSCESEYALRVIFSRLNQELDTLRIQCVETITAIDCCTQSYSRSFHFR
ncbi:uncharacterized protein LOC124292251 [Haliotis rubra]|uniref:uncharacterized protein LOC124292251 n=1 Tax=Haliotis rubra TaxID=36100 RepID=UPI001EE56960|nr:uncharacterized protein LOC124292251 [Haliotis rubra]